MALTQDPTQADDLVQDSLERAWDKRRTWRLDSNLRAWLFSIMHNTFVNSIRRNKLASDYAESLRQQQIQAQEDTGYMIRDIHYALRQLRVEYREVVILAGLEGLSYKEIAQITDTPPGTVMSRLSRGREELRELLSEQKQAKVVPIK